MARAAHMGPILAYSNEKIIQKLYYSYEKVMLLKSNNCPAHPGQK